MKTAWVEMLWGNCRFFREKLMGRSYPRGVRSADFQRQRSAEKTEYLLDGQWLIDRNYRAKNEVKREVLKRGQKMDLFKLGEGPFSC